ncbi:MAG TPA: hypothetical protein VM388_12430 [Acidimicrobiales bacterium]|nr:hypothetical protein [Acidimicrobiales bacterium]
MYRATPAGRDLFEAWTKKWRGFAEAMDVLTDTPRKTMSHGDRLSSTKAVRLRGKALMTRAPWLCRSQPLPAPAPTLPTTTTPAPG